MFVLCKTVNGRKKERKGNLKIKKINERRLKGSMKEVSGFNFNGIIY